MVVNAKLKSLLQSFKYDEGVKPLVSRVSKPKNTKVDGKSKVKHDAYDGYKDLPPSLTSNLTVIFIGFNPGMESSRAQHHYAHFSNSFWKLFNQSQLFARVIQRDKILSDEYIDRVLEKGAKPEDDYELAKYNIGFTDLVLRCTKSAQELTTDEKVNNVPRLIVEFNNSNSKYIVFIGKGIWEIVIKYLAKQLGIKFKLSTKNFTWGIQDSNVQDILYQKILTSFHKQLPENAKVYVFPNTSGLVTSMNFDQKLGLWQHLTEDIGNI